MHYADPTKSERLARMLRAIKAHPAGITTIELQALTMSCAVSTDISELRQSGYRIDRYYKGKTVAGRQINSYVYRGRKVD